MPLAKFEIQVLLHQYWEKGLTTRGAAKEICNVESIGTVAWQTAAKWFQCFNDGDFDLADKPRTARSRDLALAVGVSSHQTVLNHLHQRDFVQKRIRQDPNELTQDKNKSSRNDLPLALAESIGGSILEADCDVR